MKEDLLRVLKHPQCRIRYAERYPRVRVRPREFARECRGHVVRAECRPRPEPDVLPARDKVCRRRREARGSYVEWDQSLRTREAAVIQTAVCLIGWAVCTSRKDEADGRMICRLHHCDGVGSQMDDREVCQHPVGHDGERRFVAIVRAEPYVQRWDFAQLAPR